MTALHLLTLTTLFPNSRRPRHGIFVANRLRRLCETGRIDATVVAAIPRFPGVYRDATSVPAIETLHGLPVAHPRYLHVPGIGMRMQPDALAKALLRHLERAEGRRSYDVIDAHYFYPDGVAAAQVAEALDLPLVISARGSDINLIAEDRYARRRILESAERAQALIAVSAALATRMQRLGMPSARISILRNGVDGAMFALVPRQEARRRLGVDASGPLILGVGNVVPEKGFDLLVRAVAELDGTRALIIGEGREVRNVRALAHAVAPGRVELRASMPQDELRFAYAAADVLVQPSLREGWPNVLLESLACGTPVVAAAVGGVPEIVCAPEAGTTVADRTPASWAAAIRQMLEAPPPREVVRAHAMKFGWDEIIDRQCALYEDVSRRWKPAVGPVKADPTPQRDTVAHADKGVAANGGPREHYQ